MSVVVATAPEAAPPRREWAVFATRLARRRTALFGFLVVDVLYTYLDPRIRLR